MDKKTNAARPANKQHFILWVIETPLVLEYLDAGAQTPAWNQLRFSQELFFLEGRET